MSLALAFGQVIHPVTAIIETTGQVVDLVRDTTSTPAVPRYHPMILFRTTNGDMHSFTADFSQTDPAIPDPALPATYRTHIGDIVPIQYYPWAPAEAQLGAVGKIFIIAVGLQYMLLLGSGVVGFVLLGMSGYLFSKGRRFRKVPHL